MSSTTILCQIQRAQKPYYIEDADLRIGSIEELCHFLQYNLPLVDLSFFSTNLLEWMENELGTVRLVHDLHRNLTEIPDPQLPDLIMPVMRETGWLTVEEERVMRAELRAIEAQPVAVRLKQRADAYVWYRKYAKAVRIYEMVLKLKQTEKLGHSFSGTVWYNKGVAHARLFQMEEAVICMRSGYQQLHTMQSLRGLLFCVWMSEGEEAFRQTADELGVDPDRKDSLAGEIRGLQVSGTSGNIGETLDNWVKEYRRETEL